MALTGKELFDQTTLECSKLVTLKYSTSFSLGIKTLDKKFHLPIYAIYGFVRFADEIVDTFHDHDKAALLEEFRLQTFKAIKEGLSFNPILHSFQKVVNDFHIDPQLIEAFLFSMEMDLTKTIYNQQDYETYIYGSAEVVGLMCLKVFCEGDEDEYQRLLPPAKKLGAAFQKVNFLRDLKSDYEERGRIYFPDVDFRVFSQKDKLHIEADIEADFKAAYEGIKQLPMGARMGVHLAYVYYLKLFEKIRTCPANRIMNERIRIPDSKKLGLLLETWIKYRMNLGST
jgi:phytoene/squalene synthetase